MLALFVFSIVSAFAGTDSVLVFDKSYPRDNSICTVNGERIELMIRGGHKYTEPREADYGEYLFIKHLPEKKAELLPINDSKEDTYRLFMGSSPLCGKSHGYSLTNSTFALLLLKENRPFADKLVIQLFDSKTLKAKEHIETQYPADKAMKTSDGFAFRTLQEIHSPDFGKVIIENETFLYHEKNFPQWLTYGPKGFEISPELTYLDLPWRNTFKDQEEFLVRSGWDPKKREFKNLSVFLAVNHKTKKECLLFIEKKMPLAGTETWKCYDI
jgi:hypothetical protein